MLYVIFEKKTESENKVCIRNLRISVGLAKVCFIDFWKLDTASFAGNLKVFDSRTRNDSSVLITRSIGIVWKPEPVKCRWNIVLSGFSCVGFSYIVAEIRDSCTVNKLIVFHDWQINDNRSSFKILVAIDLQTVSGVKSCAVFGWVPHGKRRTEAQYISRQHRLSLYLRHLDNQSVNRETITEFKGNSHTEKGFSCCIPRLERVGKIRLLLGSINISLPDN